MLSKVLFLTPCIINYIKKLKVHHLSYLSAGSSWAISASFCMMFAASWICSKKGKKLSVDLPLELQCITLWDLFFFSWSLFFCHQGLSAKLKTPKKFPTTKLLQALHCSESNNPITSYPKLVNKHSWNMFSCSKLIEIFHEFLRLNRSGPWSVDSFQLVSQMNHFGSHIVYSVIQFLKEGRCSLQEKLMIYE